MEIQEPYSCTTDDIVVEVIPKFLEERSNIDENIYAYSYKVSIKNSGSSIVQLINRHWKVYSAETQIADIKGEGVIGKQPVIKPKETHSYQSMTITNNPIGHMQGNYTFYSAKGHFFDVEIPKFDLLYVDTTYIH